MNIYIMLAIILANVIAISIVYQFIKRLNKKEKILFIAVCVAIVYILISIVYWFSGFKIDKTIHEKTKSFVTFMFVPVNVILFIPYIAFNYIKLKDKKIKREIFIKKCMVVGIVAIIVLIGEYFYFKNIQQNISKISENVQNAETKNEIIEENTNALNEQTNQLTNTLTNEIVNKIVD